MAEIRFKQSDVVAVVGLSESSIIRYRKKKVFIPTFEQSKHGKTYMIDSVGIKQIINEYNIGRTVDPVDFNDVMIRLYQRAALEPPIEYVRNNVRQPIEQPMNNTGIQFDSNMNSQRVQFEQYKDTQRTQFDNNISSHEYSLNNDDDYSIIEGEYSVKDSDQCQTEPMDSHNIPKSNPIYDINNPPPMEEFITAVVDKMVGDMKKQLNEKIADLAKKQADMQLLLEASTDERERLKKEKEDAEKLAFGYVAYYKQEKIYKDAPWLDKITKKIKKPDPKDYGIEI